jgi:hypothetical protein
MVLHYSFRLEAIIFFVPRLYTFLYLNNTQSDRFSWLAHISTDYISGLSRQDIPGADGHAPVFFYIPHQGV